MDYSVAVHEVGNIVTLMKYSISKLKEEYPEIMGSDHCPVGLEISPFGTG